MEPRVARDLRHGVPPGDQAAAWAMYVHQQRFPDDYRDALALPLALHLAKQATEYALPHELTDGTGEQVGEGNGESRSEDGDTLDND